MCVAGSLASVKSDNQSSLQKGSLAIASFLVKNFLHLINPNYYYFVNFKHFFDNLRGQVLESY